MNSKIILSLASILASVGIIGAATYAYFSDNATSNNNVFASGTLDLKLDDIHNLGVFTDSISASLGGSNMAPGASASGFISLHNSGSIAINKVKFGANPTASSGANLASVLDLTVKTGSNNDCSLDTNDLTPTISSTIGDHSPPLTLAELEATDYNALPGLALSSSYYLCLRATMENSAGNSYQNSSVTEDFVFEADQDASQ